MLVIRKAQLQALQEDLKKRQVAELMRKTWPEECEQLGPAGLQPWIDLGFQKASSYDMHDPAEAVRFIHLMFALGEDFDTAPETAWAGTILHWAGASNELKLAALEKRAEDELAGGE